MGFSRGDIQHMLEDVLSELRSLGDDIFNAVEEHMDDQPYNVTCQNCGNDLDIDVLINQDLDMDIEVAVCDCAEITD